VARLEQVFTGTKWQLFAAVYQLTRRYTSTYALLSIVGLSGVTALFMCGAAGRRERAAA
jgi:hypothetical protein